MAGVDDEREPNYLVRSVAKAFSVLELFDTEGPQLTGADISVRTGMNRATTYRFCQTLTKLGYLEQLQDGSYRLGLNALRLARAALAGQADLVDIARPVLQRLRDDLGETVNMGIWDQGEVVYVLRLKTEQILNIGLAIGSRLPPHASSLGKAMMAFLQPDDLGKCVDSLSFGHFTDTTVTSREELVKELTEVRAQGYALNLEELAPGLRGVAAPILSSTGRPIAAINIALTRPISASVLSSQFAPPVVAAANEISERMLYSDLPEVST